MVLCYQCIAINIQSFLLLWETLRNFEMVADGRRTQES